MNFVEKIRFRFKMKKDLKPYYNDRKTYHVGWIHGKDNTISVYYSNSFTKIYLIAKMISRMDRGRTVCTYIWKNISANDRCAQRWDIKGSFDNKSGRYMEGYIYSKKKQKFELYFGTGS